MGGEILIWGAVVAALANVFVIGKMFVDAGATMQKAAAAEKSAHEAHQRIDALATASREFVTGSQVNAAVAPLRDDIRQLTQRLDNVLATLAAHGA